MQQNEVCDFFWDRPYYPLSMLSLWNHNFHRVQKSYQALFLLYLKVQRKVPFIKEMIKIVTLVACNFILLCLFSNYKSSTEEDHGQVLCWASNGLGEQIQPCVFRVVPLASPASPKDCRVIPNTFFTPSTEFSKDALFFLSPLLLSGLFSHSNSGYTDSVNSTEN